MLDFHEIFQAVLYPVVVYILLLVLARSIGKKLLGQITYFDFVIGITLGTIGGAFVTTEVRGYYVLLSATILAFLVYLTGVLTLRSVTARKIIEGEPLVLIQNGKIYEENLRKIRYNQDDLAMQLREKGAFDLSEVEFAILEPHGQLSLLKKSQNLPLTPKDLGMPTQYTGVSTEIIRDGRIQAENLKQNHLSHEWLFKELAGRGILDIGEVFLASLATDGTLYVDLREDTLDYVQKVEDDVSRK